MEEINITDIEGIKIGHTHNREAVTGSSVVIFENGATAGVDVRGGAPGTRETALLQSDKMIDKIHAVILSGGSAFGLDAASGVMKYLEEKAIGFDVGVTRVPIVSSAILFDLDIGSSSIRPDATMGYNACLNASNKVFNNGNIGAGMGATIGKIAGPERAMKGGLGSVCYKVGKLKVGAMVAVNCLGDIIDPEQGKIIAGVLNDSRINLAGTEKMMMAAYDKNKNIFGGNTTLGIVITNAKLTKVEVNKVASIAHNGYGKTISPAHSQYDGDSIFATATDKVKADINVVSLLAVKAVENAVLNGVKSASSIAGYKTYNDFL